MTMTTEPLFFEPSEEIEKRAGEVDLPDDPNRWPQEILQELYKQVPYITDFQPAVQMNKVDAEQGYGLGHVELRNETAASPDADAGMLESAGVRSVRLPFVIKQNKLSPFDLLVTDGANMLPLTENRLRQALFRPQAFDVTSKGPGDQSMVGQLYPPYRQNHNFGGGGSVLGTGAMGKMGSAESLESFINGADNELSKESGLGSLVSKGIGAAGTLGAATAYGGKKLYDSTKQASVLDAILPTINHSDLESFAHAVEKNGMSLFGTEAGLNGLQKVANAEPVDIRAMQWEDWVQPSVTQIVKVADGYLVKQANHVYWSPTHEVVNRGDVIKSYGVKVAMEADTNGAVTIAEGAEAEGGDTELDLGVVTEPGMYKVLDEGGTEHLGFVVPQLIDTDGTVLPLQLFTNGTVSAVQADILGEPAGQGANLPSGMVGGNGAFYTVDPEGKVHMTVPMEVQSSYSMPDEPSVLSAETFDGRPVEVSVQPNIQEAMSTGERLLIPQHWLWLPLENSQSVSLRGGDAAEEAESEEAFAEKQSHVIIRGDGDTFSFSGDPVEKLAYADKNFLDIDDSMFLLAGLGVKQEHGVTKLAEAAYHSRPIAVKTGRSLELKADVVKEAQAKAAHIMQQLPNLKTPHLVKEASNFPDPLLVDTVLSLGFLNPENLTTFISYLPELEQAQTKLCSLLLAVRLGLQNIPQSSLERSVRSLEETIEGLKVLAFQGS